MPQINFNKDVDNIIINYMTKLKGSNRKSCPFAMLSRKIPYSPNQILQHWCDKLDPKLCKTSFNYNEKNYIINWVMKFLAENDKNISWKKLQSEMVNEFGILRSKRDMKNFWYARKRRQDRQKENVLDLQLLEDRYF
ncbi:hypothetical protein RhiirA5_426033 [Rhizophagus irregularis]|uniref:Uncharacterized protein n=2 Tax=Rhizophagus irregularis TaxID=588596 RepID=U9TYP2_RHIID|nr:hypothetical protein GLOIN_2v1770435 [Rhizophagus irregularis DAOM 181602=DAOM 197198]PKC01879.1 hypothetical protein RhiirA5_426033 [Rhizophagus irregularis]PKC62584.1 hypothetical protein RhiirA1_464939 [Rhizophagus irregularis]PKK65315.1 hypothetical protein RhiirC2_786336 [Rhizophagus irregularis]PKY29863.1 hypothetical protein RhiirB3_446666 [Rhizophagus irregularis]POG75232.1 hypothetical protein GLOIN_2v1770435 [Rhizophagus irregularis DAOM 181602=DAOM 197198]|eukprot:XP_025182098.1 hypothetical protein GLOIN_2v1770435 [Rhizophagus irregularis DAOM 181602=DAOM 197198]